MNSLSKESKITSLPTNANSSYTTYREGTDDGDKLIAAEADCRRMKALAEKGRAATSTSGQYDVQAGKKFFLTKYCAAEKLTKQQYSTLYKRLSGTRKRARALSTKPTAVNNRRCNRKKNGMKVAAKKVGRKSPAL